MAKEAYLGNIDDKAKKVKKIYLGSNEDLAKKVKKVYIGDENNIAELCFHGGTRIGDLPVGTRIALPFQNDSGTFFNEFLIVHQGELSGYTHGNCTWILWLFNADDRYLTAIPLYQFYKLYLNTQSSSIHWDESGSNEYANSDIHTLLNTSIFSYLNPDIQEEVVEGKIPYITNGTVKSGNDGLTTKIFLPSIKELGLTSTSVLADGACWNYFSTDATNKRLGLIGTTLQNLISISPVATRTPSGTGSSAYGINASGTFTTANVANTVGIYNCALALNPDFKLFDVTVTKGTIWKP